MAVTSALRWGGNPRLERTNIVETFATAALNQNGWVRGLQMLAQHTGSLHAGLSGFSRESGYFHWIPGLPKSAMDEYYRRFNFDPEKDVRIASSHSSAIGSVVHEDDYARLITLPAYKDYVDFTRRYDIQHGCQAIVYDHADTRIVVFLLRSTEQGRTTDDQRALFASLLPAIQFAVRTQIALEGHAQAYARGSLQAVLAAAILVDAAGLVKAATPAAHEFMTKHKCIRVETGRIETTSPAANQKIRDAIYEITGRNTHVGSSGAAKPISLVLEEQAVAMGTITIDIAPIATSDWSFGMQPAAVVTLKFTPSDHLHTVIDRAGKMGLTASEASVAALLATGHTREKISEIRGVSLGTIRIQLKSIFRKLGVARESELVLKMAHRLE